MPESTNAESASSLSTNCELGVRGSLHTGDNRLPDLPLLPSTLTLMLSASETPFLTDGPASPVRRRERVTHPIQMAAAAAAGTLHAWPSSCASSSVSASCPTTGAAVNRRVVFPEESVPVTFRFSGKGAGQVVGQQHRGYVGALA